MLAFIRTTAVTLILSGLVLFAYWQLSLDHQRRAVEELQQLNAQMQAQLQARQAMIDRLSRSRRIAHLQVIKQTPSSSHAGTSADAPVLDTTVLFIELDDAGTELARQTLTVPGDVLFVDALTVKFDSERVAEGDPLLGRTLVLLRRIYSDRMPAIEGIAIDTPGAIPPGYAASDAGQFEKQLWENFWALATDADKARQLGVRVAQGEAVYKPVRAGQTYELVVDAVGGMSLLPLPRAEPGKEREELTQVDG